MRSIATSMIVWMTSALRSPGKKLAVRTGVKDVDALFMRLRALHRFASWIGGRCQIEQQHIYEAVSSHYLHFSDCQAVSEDVRAYVAQQMLGNAPKEPASFCNEMESKLADYFSEKPFSSSEVCCGIRIAVVGVLFIDMRKLSYPPI